LKHLKEKPHHKIPCHESSIFFLWRTALQQTLWTHCNLKASLPPFDEDNDDDYYFYPFPSNVAPVE
jgi:hypothetical protein